MKTRVSPTLCGFLAAATGPLLAQVSVSSLGPGLTYQQDFNTLPTADATWTDNSTLANWYANAEDRSGAGSWDGTIRASAGAGVTGSLYSYGAAASSERALGSLSTGGTLDFAYGIRLLNDTATTFTQFRVTYTLEQWRRDSSLNLLDVYYQIAGVSLTDPQPGTTGAPWTQITELTLAGPQVGSGTSLDGNAAANRASASFIATGVSFGPNQELFVRWYHNETSGNPGLAIDDVAIGLPEPGTWAAGIATAGLTGWRFFRRRRAGAA